MVFPPAGLSLAAASSSAAGAAGKAATSFNPVGLAIGVAATGISFLLSRSNQRGPDLQELDISSVSEGDPIYRVYGTRSRVPGQVIWADGFETDETSHDKAISYRYKTSLAVSFSFGPRTISKIFANGKVIYDVDSDADFTGDITITVSPIAVTRYILTSPGVNWIEENFVDQNQITLSGFANPAINGTFSVRSVTEDEIEITTPVPLSNETAVGANATQDNDEHNSRYVDGVTVYPGDLVQMPDPLMEQFLGVGNVPAYRSICYASINDLILNEFGNNLPTFEAEVISGQVTVGAAVGAILQDAGMLVSQFDVSALTDTLEGYWVRGGQTPKDSLIALQEAFSFYWQEVGTKLVFKKRGLDEEILVPDSALAAHEYGSDTERPWRVDPGDPDALPSEVVVKYRESVENEQVASQSCRRYGFTRENQKTVDLSTMVMTASKAQDICRNVMWSTVVNETTFAGQLPPSQWNLIEGDYCRILGRTLRIQEITRGNNGLVAFTAFEEQKHTLLHNGSPAQPARETNPNANAVGSVDFGVFDIAAFRPPDTTVRGFYIVPAFVNPAVTWLGATAYIEPNSNPTQNSAQVESQFQGILGEATTVLPLGTYGAVDQVSTVRVNMLNGQLASVSDEEFYEGANACALGNEILLFRDVLQTGDTEYELSYLIRGWRNTESERGTHALGEKFALLAQTGLIFVPITSTQSYHIAVVPTGGNLSNAPVQIANLSGNTVRRFSPWIISGIWLPNGAARIEWFTRDRNFWEIFTPDPAPGFNPGIVRVELLSGPGGSTLSFWSVQQASNFYLSPAAVTAFGFTAGNPITFRLRQVAGPNELDSRWEEITIT